jgi:hypothetical protein
MPALDSNALVSAGDIYFVQTKFFTRLLDLFEDHWKRERIRDGEATQYVGFFNPEVL